MRKIFVTTAAIAAAAALAAPAAAAETTATTSVTAGALSITAPTSAVLGSAAAGTRVAAALGAVKVDDARSAAGAAWTATVSSTDFTTGGTTPQTIAKANVDYWSGAATATTGIATFTPGQPLATNKVALDAAKTAFSASLGTGSNSATWSPTVGVNLPAAAIAGDYSGAVTHSVA